MRPLPSLDELRACRATPHYFGLGFIQIKVSASRRYHFWVPDWPTIPGAASQAHNHRYPFSSTVLFGRIRQELFRLGPLKAHPEGADLEVAEVSCQPGDSPRVVGYGQLERVLDLTTHAGGSYRLTPRDFHVSWAPGPAITCLDRGPTVLAMAQVVRPVGAPAHCPFAGDMGEEACWDRIGRMLAEAASRARESA